MTWTVERVPCKCGERFATYEAHMAHRVYVDKRPVRCIPPGDIPGLRFDGKEWTHLAVPAENLGRATPVEVAESSRITREADRIVGTVRTAPDYDRTCVECGTVFQRPAKRGRPPSKCPDCRSK